MKKMTNGKKEKDYFKTKDVKNVANIQIEPDKVPVYAVYDKEARTFDIPFFSRSDIFAKRKFTMDIKAQQASMIGFFKDEFELHRIGTYDQTFGQFLNNLENNRCIMKGSQLITEVEE
jgi:hypothetical protein